MKMLKMCFRPHAFLLIFSSIGCLTAIPLSSPQTQEELLKDIEEFLHENQDVAKAFRNLDLDSFNTRNRRDAIDDSMMDVDIGNGNGPPMKKEEGFFDRAAKFMMEVLQRFLKWVNSDN